jgi:hypothetical protein
LIIFGVDYEAIFAVLGFPSNNVSHIIVQAAVVVCIIIIFVIDRLTALPRVVDQSPSTVILLVTINLFKLFTIPEYLELLPLYSFVFQLRVGS